MENILFEHNQKAYVAASEMLAQTGRAAIIHPTGTGKSFIAFELCVENGGKKVCFLSPSEYIFKTQMEKWNAAGGATLTNLQFITYARLMRMGEDELAKIAPDYIILDEFHRCGAAQWGGGVERLREMYPEAKVLGLSATNIRYLDNQRDMAWELFGGNVASELTLGAAVATGILPAPKYVLSVYSYRKELQRYEMRVRQARNKAVRDKAEKELEALRRALEKADGLEDVFARHMLAKGGEEREAEPGRAGNREERKATRKRAGDGEMEISRKREPSAVQKTVRQADGFGRYIVFCASYEHLVQMRELAPEWFAKVDSTPHIYTAYSDDPAASAEFEAFKADTSRHLKLLYCIDMLNEGIHVDGVDGVILLRPTVSPTIYKQQIGRALAAGGKKVPVIFDIVMNIENLCSIGAIEEELRGAVFAYQAGGRGDAIVNEHFRVIDELGDCRRLFAQLNETLGASWDAMYEMAKEYYQEHGNLEVPAHYATKDGYSLGAWVLTQRKVYAGKTAGCLSREQVERLSAIGMRWQGTQEAAWERNFAEAEKYFKEHGDLEVPADFVTESGCRLGRWLRRQREKYQNLIDSQNLPMGAENKNSKKSPAMMRSKVEAEHIRRLTEIGMLWETVDSWEQRFELAKQYYEEHGNLRMASNYVSEGVWLERWLREQKARLVEGMKDSNPKEEKKQHKPLTEEQKQKLASIGVSAGMSKAERSWREQYGEAEEFYRRYGNLAVPKRYVAGNGKKLGIWLQHQRANHRSGKLAGWQVQMLNGIGMAWEAADSWEQGLEHAKKYFLANGHLLVPYHYVCSDGYRLGKWISNQRLAHSGLTKRSLDEGRVQQLEVFGMVWNVGQGRRSRE